MHLPPVLSAPIAFQQIQWALRPMKFMDECARKYGDIFGIRLSSKLPPLLIVSSPDALQTILTSDNKQLSAPGELNAVFEGLMGKNSLITISGNQHQRQRQLLTPPLHGDRLRGYSDTIAKITEDALNAVPENTTFAIRDVTQLITLRAIMQIVFGVSNSDRDRKLELLLSELLEGVSSPWSMAADYFPRFGWLIKPFISRRNVPQILRDVDSILYELIQERRDQTELSGSDILSLLMSARDEAGEAMTDEELRDELMTLLLAGHETTATAIAWAMYWIHKYPQVREKLIQELNDLGENPDYTTVFKAPYLNAVCNETLRINPVAMLLFPRRVEKPISIAGYNLEPDAILIGSIYLTHRRPDLYPNPLQFRPERFLERQYSPYEFLPFGGGVRRCIGLAFAALEMKFAIAQMMRTFEFDLVTTQDVRPMRRGLVSGPDCKIEMALRKRKANMSPVGNMVGV